MNYQLNQSSTGRVLIFSLLVFVFIQIFAGDNFAQNRKGAPKSAKKQTLSKSTNKSVDAQNPNLPKVTQIDEIALKDLLKRGETSHKPLLVNFWATWCDPCREEFPELVEINHEYADKIDFVTVSLDDLAEIKRDVPKFLVEMKATMPAYLLKTEDEQAAIATISKDYAGGLPFTILFDGSGATAYFVQGKVKPDILRAELDKISTGNTEINLDKGTEIKLRLRRAAEESQNPYQKGTEMAREDIMSDKLQLIIYGEGTSVQSKVKVSLKNKYNVEMLELGCKMSAKLLEYIKGYNEVSAAEIKLKFGNSALETLGQN